MSCFIRTWHAIREVAVCIQGDETGLQDLRLSTCVQKSVPAETLRRPEEGPGTSARRTAAAEGIGFILV
jgi:hypothetical protein